MYVVFVSFDRLFLSFRGSLANFQRRREAFVMSNSSKSFEISDNSTKTPPSMETIFAKCSFSEDDDDVVKLLKIKSVIEQHKDIISEYCSHVDITDGLIDTLDFYCYTAFYAFIKPRNSTLVSAFNELNCKNEFLVARLFLNLYYISGIPCFLQLYSQHFRKADDQDIDLDAIAAPFKFNTAFIIFADSDINAALDSLSLHSNESHIHVQKVWVQDPIIKKFGELQCTRIKTAFELSGFRSKQELCTNLEDASLDSIAIWSEDIVSAKNLAMRIKVGVIYINGSKEVHSAIASISTRYIYQPACNKMSEAVDILDLPEIQYISKFDRPRYSNIYNLYYNGTWKSPIMDTYWEDPCTNLWAMATKADIDDCLKYAKAGFKTWSSLSTNSRREILSGLSPALVSHEYYTNKNNPLWWKCLNTYYSTSFLARNESVEIMITREPLGVVLLTDTTEHEFFHHFFVALYVGNSVIIITQKDKERDTYEFLKTIASCDLPKGVVNCIGTNQLDKVVNTLKNGTTVVHETYTDVLDAEFSYVKYTSPKYVLLPLN